MLVFNLHALVLVNLYRYCFILKWFCRLWFLKLTIEINAMFDHLPVTKLLLQNLVNFIMFLLTTCTISFLCGNSKRSNTGFMVPEVSAHRIDYYWHREDHQYPSLRKIWRYTKIRCLIEQSNGVSLCCNHLRCQQNIFSANSTILQNIW